MEGFWDDPNSAKDIMAKLDGLKDKYQRFLKSEESLSNIEVVFELAKEDESIDIESETKSFFEVVDQEVKNFEFEKMLSGPNDASNAFLQISAGAGGTESCDWVSMLLRMYSRYAERKGFSSELLDFTDGDGAGYRSITLQIKGEHAYGLLKAEVGVHRLVRISPFDANKKRHTSFASVFVYPEVDDDIEVEINPADLRIDTFRAGGAGGQHVNTTDSAVRITHLPTNTVVQCQNERSQHQNKDVAMKMLKAKLYEIELEKQQAERAEVEGNKKENAWGSQIRSYVLHPYKMVKDHRTELDIPQAEKVLDGDLDELIKTYLMNY
jgi:peptide chain release factor 2